MNEKNFNIREWQKSQGITGNLSGVSNIKEAFKSASDFFGKEPKDFKKGEDFGDFWDGALAKKWKPVQPDAKAIEYFDSMSQGDVDDSNNLVGGPVWMDDNGKNFVYRLAGMGKKGYLYMNSNTSKVLWTKNYKQIRF